MNRKLMIGPLTMLLIVSLLAAGTGPAWGQDDMETFKKPSWRLTLQYPPGWEVSEESGVVSFAFDDSAGDVAVFAVAQDQDYANKELTLEDLFWIFMDKVGGQAENLSVEETDPRQIAGVEARSGLLTATDAASGLEMGGTIYQLVKGGKGYLVLALATSGYLDAHQPDFDAMLDSLKIGAAAPTRTPTPKKPTPRPRRTATPTPTEEAETPAPEPTKEATDAPEPTETPSLEATEAVIATAEISPAITVTAAAAITATPAVTVTPAVPVSATIAAAPPLTGTPVVTATAAIAVTPGAITGTTKAVSLSARKAYDLARVRAEAWQPDAALTRADCPVLELSGPDQGRCQAWTFLFVKRDGKDFLGFDVQVSGGKARVGSEVDPKSDIHPIDPQWLDSPDVMPVLFSQVGGSQFKPLEWYRAPTASANLSGPVSADSGRSAWEFVIRGSSDPQAEGGEEWLLRAEAASGDLYGLTQGLQQPVKKALTARQALKIAQKEAENWQDDTELVEVSGEANPGDPGQAQGQAGAWTFYFRSPSAGETDQFVVSNGQVVSQDSSVLFADYPAIIGNWPDSPQALKDLRANYPAYAAFSQQFPDHAWRLHLSEADGKHFWSLGAQSQGVSLRINPQVKP